MMHTITGYARSNGLQFSPEQLDLIGIRPGGTAWGLFVDSASLDVRADLRDEAAYDNQGVHMVLSALHPDRWLTCFRIQVMMQRKRAAEADRAQLSVTYGLFDALARCNINVLDCSKGLMGYDAVSLTATCECPDLRIRANTLLNNVDELAISLFRSRPSESDPVTAARIAKLNGMRRNALAEIGASLMERLTVLQARLMLIDAMRYRWQQDTGFRSEIGTLAPAEGLAAIMGRLDAGDPVADPDPYGLLAPWFLHRKIINLGENPYFVDTAQAMKSSASNADASVYTRLFTELKRLGVQYNLEHQARADANKFAAEPWSYFWNRVDGQVANPDSLRTMMTKGTYLRAFTSPILIHAMPMLAYERMWALPFRLPNVNEHPRFIEFEFDGSILRDVSRKSGVFDRHVDSMGQAYKTLNTWSRLNPSSGEVKDHQFDYRAGIVAGVNLQDRFMRMRLVRAGSDRQWGKLEVGFAAVSRSAADEGASTRGLLAYLTRILANEGFRIEDVKFLYDRIDQKEERGRVLLVLQAGHKNASEIIEKGGFEEIFSDNQPWPEFTERIRITSCRWERGV